MKYSSNDRGALPLLVALLVVAVVAVVGVAVYNASKSKTKDAQTVKASPTPSSSPVTTASPAAKGTIPFTVKELGIQFKISEDIKDLVYVARTTNGLSVARFSTASLVAADKNAGGTSCGPDGDALGAISLNSSTHGGETAIRTFGNKILNYANPQSVCSQDGSVMSLAGKQVKAFMQALNSAELVQ